jgi:hypothetical protein
MGDEIVLAGISRRDGSAADGIHLLWSPPRGSGYSIGGFDIQRRKAERTKISCYTLSQAELAQLHAQFELRIPFARIGVRRSACPTAMVQSPPGVKDRVSRSVDFAGLAIGRVKNPLNLDGLAFQLLDRNGNPARAAEIVAVENDRGLRIASRLVVTLPPGTFAARLSMQGAGTNAAVEGVAPDGTAIPAKSVRTKDGRIVASVEAAAVGQITVQARRGSPVLMGVDVPDQEIWPAAKGMVAIARAKGAAFVDRRPFAPSDRTALSFASAGGPDAGAQWTVEDGRLKLAEAGNRAFALFGDADWNHLTVQVEVQFDQSAGVAVGLPQSSPQEGLFAALERSGAAVHLVIQSRSAGGSFVELDRKAVGNAPGAETALALTIDAFDDRLRATVLDTVVEVDRNAVRDGRLALFGEGTATFASLQVRGLDIFRFPFSTSRYVSFVEHIGSFAGALAVARPNDLGPGSTITNVADLWMATRTEIAAAMLPDADATARQDLFDRWGSGLGLPIRQEVQALALTQFSQAAQPDLILLESPEPLDFTKDVTLELVRVQSQPQARVLARPPRVAVRPGVIAPAAGGVLARNFPTRLPELEPDRRRAIILSVVAIKKGYRIELDAAALAESGAVQDQIVVAERTASGVVFYRARWRGRHAASGESSSMC